MVLVDTNVLLDVVEDDPAWADWSQGQLEVLGLRERLCVNAVVYAELSLAFSRIDELEQVLADGDLAVEEIPREALFLAAKAFLRYRRQASGPKIGVLPDFFIGAHAAVTGMPLLTRDVSRFRTYFPTVRLISPD